MGQKFIIFLSLFTLSQSLWAQFRGSNVDAIYYTDDREMVSKKSPAKIQEIARSVGYIAYSDALTKGLLKTTIKASSLKETANLCEDVKFSSSRAGSGCTGFLVGKDILISAGHCFKTDEDCAGKKIIFDLDEKKQTAQGYSVSNGSVYSCKKIIATAYTTSDEDYSIIQLDKAPAGRKALALNRKNDISEESKVFMIGHPMGMPQVYSKEASVVENASELRFKAELDSFSGNSGSPVINAKTFEVEGILVGGQEDLVFDSENKCYRNTTYEHSGGESVFKISAIPAFN